MVCSLPAGGLALALLVLLASACDVFDYRPAGKPDVDPDERLSASIDMEAAPDTIGLWSTGIALQYSVRSEFEGNIVVRTYLGGKLMAEVPNGTPILLDLRNMPGGFYQLRVEAVALMGRHGAKERGEQIIGRVERTALIESGIVFPARDVQATYGAYLALNWQPSRSFSVYGYAIHRHHRVDTVYGRMATSWVDSSFTGGNSTYTVEALSRRMKASATAVQVRSSDVTLEEIRAVGAAARLTWEPPAFTGPLRGFVVERTVPDQPYERVLATLPDPAARAFVDTTLGLGPDVTYRVRSLGGCLPDTPNCRRPRFVSDGGRLTFSPGVRVPVLEARVFDPRTRTLLGISHACSDGAAACITRTAIGGTVPLQQRALAPEVHALAVAPDGTVYAATSTRVLRLDAETLAPVDAADAALLGGWGFRIQSLAAANDGTLAILGYEEEKRGGTLYHTPRFALASFLEKRPLATPEIYGSEVQISPDARLVVVDNWILYEYDGATLRHVRTFAEDEFSGLALTVSPDFQHVVEAVPGAILLRDLRTGALRKRIPTTAQFLIPWMDPVTGHVGGSTDTGRFHVYRMDDGALLHDVPAEGGALWYALYDDVLYYGTDRCLPLD